MSTWHVLLLTVLLLISAVDGKGMWGRRKRQDEQEVQPNGGFEASRRAAAASATAFGRGDAAAAATDFGEGVGSVKFGEELKQMIEMYIGLMENAISMPDFAKTVTPEAIRKMLDQVPGLSSNPQVAAVIDSPQFTDPDQLIETVRTGVATLRTYVNDLVDVLNDPVQMSQMVEQLPVEYQDMARRLLAGDTSGLASILDNLPGVTNEHKQMFKSLMAGDVSGLKRQMKGALADVNVEDSRQALLKNPELLEALGVGPEVLEDPVKFAELMEQGLADLMAGDESGDEGEGEESVASRLFARSAAA
jgi:hypothetical protein